MSADVHSVTQLAAPVRAALAATLQQVAQVGAVHAYPRHVATPEALCDLYTVTIDGTPQLRGWTVARVSQAETEPFSGGCSVLCGWELHGVMALEDSAQGALAFDDWLDAVCAVLREDDTLGGAVHSLFPGTLRVVTGERDSGSAAVMPSGLLVPEIGCEVFAGVLCRSVRLNLVTRTVLQRQA